MSKKIKEISLKDNQKVIGELNYNEERTMAFTMGRVKHKKDSIAWMITGILLFCFLVLSLGRLSIVGEFFDDIIFNLIFGWFKWPMYLFLFFVDLSIFVGWRFKFKTSVILMVLLLALTVGWLITTAMMMHFWNTGYKYHEIATAGWNKDSFLRTMNTYIHKGWLDNTIFGKQPNSWYDASSRKYGIYSGHLNGYAIEYAGGGIIAAFMTGVFGYLSLPFSFILGTFCLFLEIVWVLTGNPFYLFLTKSRRKGKKVRLLALHYKDSPYEKDKADKDDKGKDKKRSRWQEANAFGKDDDFKALDDKSTSPARSRRDKKELEFDTFNFTDDDDLKSYTISDEKPEKAFDDVQLDTLTHSEDEPKKKQHITDEETFEKTSEPTMADTEFFDEVLFDKTAKTSPKEDTLEPLDEETAPAKKKKHSLFGGFKKQAKEPKVEKEASNKVAPQPVQADAAEEKEIKKEEVDYSGYQMPNLNLLTDIKPDPKKIEENKKLTESKKEAIDNTFNQFNVKAHVKDYIIGPTVTKFEIEPEPGTKVSQVSGLENDLKFALGVQTMRLEAPIKGKNLIGIEIQNGASSIVNLKDMLEEMPGDLAKNPLEFVLGQDVLGKPLYANLAKMPHLLVAGSTGSGKSVMINTLIMSLILRNTPQQVRFMMVDPKQVELSVYTDLPHMLAPVINDPIQAQNALKKVADLMEDRYALFKEARAKNIEGYNYNRKKGRLPYLVVIVDEMADLMVTGDRKDIEESISRITAKARAAGIHLVLATQRPSVDVITGVIKSNIPTRIAFAVSSGTDSRTILDAMGAETLVGHGDMLFTPPGSSDLIRAQGAYVSDQDIEKVVDTIDAKFKPDYLWTEDNLKSFVKHSSDEKDEYFEEAKEWALTQNTLSISGVQRRFGVGYARAGRIVDQLEEAGIVGPQNGAQPRKVYNRNNDK